MNILFLSLSSIYSCTAALHRIAFCSMAGFVCMVLTLSRFSNALKIPALSFHFISLHACIYSYPSHSDRASCLFFAHSISLKKRK